MFIIFNIGWMDCLFMSIGWWNETWWVFATWKVKQAISLIRVKRAIWSWKGKIFNDKDFDSWRKVKCWCRDPYSNGNRYVDVEDYLKAGELILLKRRMMITNQTIVNSFIFKV